MAQVPMMTYVILHAGCLPKSESDKLADMFEDDINNVHRNLQVGIVRKLAKSDLVLIDLNDAEARDYWAVQYKNLIPLIDQKAVSIIYKHKVSKPIDFDEIKEYKLKYHCQYVIKDFPKINDINAFKLALQADDIGINHLPKSEQGCGLCEMIGFFRGCINK